MNVLKKEFILCPYCKTIFFTYSTPIEVCPQCGSKWETKKKEKNIFLFKIIRHIKILIKIQKIKHYIKQNKERI